MSPFGLVLNSQEKTSDANVHIRPDALTIEEGTAYSSFGATGLQATQGSHHESGRLSPVTSEAIPAYTPMEIP